MDTNTARKIAKDYLLVVNPELWSGDGKRPDSFDARIKTHNIDSKNGNELDISFEYCKEDGAWEHCCELRDKLSGDLVAMAHGYGVDSDLNLIDTIVYVCMNE